MDALPYFQIFSFSKDRRTKRNLLDNLTYIKIMSKDEAFNSHKKCIFFKYIYIEFELMTSCFEYETLCQCHIHKNQIN